MKRIVLQAGQGKKGFQKGHTPWNKVEFDKEKKKKQKLIYAKKYRRENVEKLKRVTLWRKYQITPEEFNNLLEKQNGKCLVCGILLDKQGSKSIKPHVDHDHKKGFVRGILCSKCNLLLGEARDSIEILQSAINYLTKHR